MAIHDKIYKVTMHASTINKVVEITCTITFVLKGSYP